MVLRVATLLVVSVLVLAASAWSPRNRYHSTTTTHAPRKTVMTNTTRYGSNLCHTCETYTTPCNYTFTRPCSAWLGNYSQNSTILSPQKNSTTKDLPVKDLVPDWSDGPKDLDSLAWPKHAGGRKKRASPYYKDKRRPRWNQWYNNFNRSSSPPPPASVTSTRSPGRKSYRQCTYTIAKMCTEKECRVECCDGRPMDTATGSCERSSGTGVLECLNGGALSSRRTYCLCPEGFIGTQCQHRKCSLKCQNGGACQTRRNVTGSLGLAPYNDDHCVCPSDTTGTFCETRICDKECKNNGTCMTRFHWSYCACQDGFNGAFCEKTDKEGSCPLSSNMGGECHWWSFRFECSDDQECPGLKKCCRNACLQMVCVNPYTANATCTYNNVTYNVGSTFRPDLCRVCTCNKSHVAGSDQGVMECTRLRCPDRPKYCVNITMPAGACCPVCSADAHVAMCTGNYTFPHFLNCPDELVVMDVAENSKVVNVNIDLKARDCKGDNLDVLLSDDELVAGVGEENFHLLSATSARDDKGNFAECVFHVRVRDPYPPVFLTCPDDFVEPSPGPVTWEIPVARDNVGLAIPPTSSHHPGDKMGPGDYMIEYWAEDFQGNIARCSFVVTVGNVQQQHGSNTDSPFPEANASVAAVSHTSLSVGLGIATTLFVVLLLALAFLVFRRHRKQRNAARGESALPMPTVNRVSAMTNGVGNRLGWNPSNTVGGLPQYSVGQEDVMSPPTYSRTDEMIAGLASGGAEAAELPAKSPLP